MMEMYCMRGCDQKIRSAAFVQDSMVTTEVRWDYTQEMPGNRQGTPENKLGTWVNTWGTMARLARLANILVKPGSSVQGK